MMKNSIQAMACGNCGCGLFKMFQQGSDSAGFKLLAECEKCKSVTRIETRPAELVLGWGHDSGGILAPMGPTSSFKLAPYQVEDARKRIADQVQAQIRISGYNVLDFDDWVKERDGFTWTRKLRFDLPNSGHPGQPGPLLVVRFMEAGSAEFQEAYVGWGENLLGSLRQSELLPSGLPNS